jgi:branched-chain amino acid transport system substrate-binding protein
MGAHGWQRWRVMAGLLLVCWLGACARPHVLAGNATATPPTWSVGLVGADWGPGGVEGSYSGNGAQLAIEQINAHGGIAWGGQHYQLSSVFSGASTVTDRVRDLLGHTPPIIALLGPDESATAVATLPLLASAGIPVLTPAIAPELTDPTKNGNARMILRLRPTLPAWASALASYATSHAGGPIVLATEDNDYGNAGAAALVAAGLNATAQVSLAPGVVDASAAVSTITGAHTATVICWAAEAETATLLHALRGAGWGGQFLVSATDATFIALAGGDAAGTIGLATWSPDLTDTTSQQFIAAYQARYGNLPDEHAAALYDAVNLLAAALARVGPDHAALANALLALPNTVGVAGTYHGTATGDLLATPRLVTVANNKVQLFGS